MPLDEDPVILSLTLRESGQLEVTNNMGTGMTMVDFLRTFADMIEQGEFIPERIG